MKKKILMSLAVLMIGGVFFTGCGSKDTKQDSTDTKTEESSTLNNDKKKEEVALTEDLSEYDDIEWHDSDVAKLIPVPKSTIGKIKFDSAEMLSVEIANTSNDDFKSYVKECKDLGYVEDYISTEDSYMADSKNGYSVIVEIDDTDHIMYITVTASDSTVGDVTDSGEGTEE